MIIKVGDHGAEKTTISEVLKEETKSNLIREATDLFIAHKLEKLKLSALGITDEKVDSILEVCMKEINEVLKDFWDQSDKDPVIAKMKAEVKADGEKLKGFYAMMERLEEKQ